MYSEYYNIFGITNKIIGNTKGATAMNTTAFDIQRDMIISIINGEIKVNQTLRSERELAEKYHVGRPLIREVLQKLANSGWITIRKSQPAIVNDFWKEGNLLTIIDLVNHFEEIPNEFILYFLEMRAAFTPHYVRDAVKKHYPKVVGLLAEKDALADDAASFALFDWRLQKQLASLSHNPIYLLILNSFEPVYIKLATYYFSIPACREASANYYESLMEVALKGDDKKASQEVSTVMQTSIDLWYEHMSEYNRTDLD